LALKHAIDLSMIASVADVGSGGGFPGIPLAIKYPHVLVLLIEVNQKKVRFLQEVIRVLGLANVSISDYDWRTFLRQTTYDIQLFCARASLQPEELIHLFKPSCQYQHAQLVYWASAQWKPDKRLNPYIVGDISYTVDKKQRRLIVMRSAA
jgi:16S rRNA (guanine527-N7)-methyltransferase